MLWMGKLTISTGPCSIATLNGYKYEQFSHIVVQWESVVASWDLMVDLLGIYPLVNVYLTDGKSPLMGKLKKYMWPFSIAMLNCQRVSIPERSTRWQQLSQTPHGANEHRMVGYPLANVYMMKNHNGKSHKNPMAMASANCESVPGWVNPSKSH